MAHRLGHLHQFGRERHHQRRFDLAGMNAKTLLFGRGRKRWITVERRMQAEGVQTRIGANVTRGGIQHGDVAAMSIKKGQPPKTSLLHAGGKLM